MNTISFSGRSRFLNKNIRDKIRTLLTQITLRHGCTVEELNYVFLNDEELLKINIKHLQHDTYTDIITFDLSDFPISLKPPNKKELVGEIYISIDRVYANSHKLNIDKEEELIRVMCHGLLHLIGFKDKKASEIKDMRAQEEAALSLWSKI